MATLHVIYDPFCGWCYGAAPLVEAARGIPGLHIALHGGGMMAGNARQRMSPQLRDFILQHDPRVAAMSGQRFGEGYRAMLDDFSVWLDSTPPTMAIVAASKFDAEQTGRELDMLDRVQRAHFLEGRHISEPGVLIDLAGEIGLPREQFTVAFASQMETAGGHIRESRELLRQLGGSGFPTFALERESGIEAIANAPYFGKPEEWRRMLERAI
jgi:putative protein-disulfide isomerase